MHIMLVLAALLALALPAAASGPPPNLSLAVDLGYRERIALPPGSTAEATLRVGAQEVARSSARLDSQQVPVRLVLDVPRAALAAGEVEVSGRITAPGGMAWSGSRSLRLDPAADRAGPVALLLVRAAAAATPPAPERRFDCGHERIVVAAAGGRAILRLGGEQIALSQAPAASGSLYRGSSANGAVEFHEQGDRARLSIGGYSLPECRPVPPDTFRAGGNEPAWRLTIRGDRAELALGIEMREQTAILGPPAPVPGGVRRVSAPGGAALAVTISAGPCRDSMSGVAFPDRVSVEAEGRRFEGCGGTLVARLAGPDWTVASIGGDAPAGERPVTLGLDAAGRVSGQGPCNRILGSWRLDDDRLVFGPLASTMMACPDPAMAQEQTLFRILQTARSWRIGETGELTIEGEGGAVVARR